MPPTVFMTTDTIGGVWQYSIDVSSGLAARGLQIMLAVCGPPASAAQRHIAEAAGVHLIDTGLPLDWTAHDRTDIIAAAQALAALARSSEADLIHLNSPALAGCAAFHAPVVAIQHSCVATWWAAVHSGELPPDLAWRAALVSQGLRAANAVIAPTNAFAAVTKEIYGLSRLPEVIPNGRSMAAVRNTRPQEEEDAAFAFTAGRLWDEGKNVAILDEAAGLTALPVLAAGSRKSPQGSEAHFENLLCLGTITEAEIADILARKPIYVSSAIYEPFGLAVLEAAQAGCPLILSDIPTFQELWQDAAIFIAPRDAKAFAAALAALASDPHRRMELGRRAKERAARYSHKAMIERICAIYASLMPASALDRRERVA